MTWWRDPRAARPSRSPRARPVVPLARAAPAPRGAASPGPATAVRPDSAPVRSAGPRGQAGTPLTLHQPAPVCRPGSPYHSSQQARFGTPRLLTRRKRIARAVTVRHFLSVCWPRRIRLICTPSPVLRRAAGAAPERVIWVAPAAREPVTWARAYWLVAFASLYSSWRRIHIWGGSPSSRPSGARSRKP